MKLTCSWPVRFAPMSVVVGRGRAAATSLALGGPPRPPGALVRRLQNARMSAKTPRRTGHRKHTCLHVAGGPPEHVIKQIAAPALLAPGDGDRGSLPCPWRRAAVGRKAGVRVPGSCRVTEFPAAASARSCRFQQRWTVAVVPGPVRRLSLGSAFAPDTSGPFCRPPITARCLGCAGVLGSGSDRSVVCPGARACAGTDIMVSPTATTNATARPLVPGISRDHS
jgi:hypothetical protein